MQKRSRSQDGFCEEPDQRGSTSARDDEEADTVTYEQLTRERAIKDGDAVVSLGADNTWENWTIENLLRDRPSKWDLSLLAVVGGKPVGYAIASSQGNMVHLHHLIVGSEWRNMGIGRELLYRLALKAREMAAARLSLKVYRQNRRAITFYTRCGFEISEDSDPELFRMVAAIDDVLRRGAA